MPGQAAADRHSRAPRHNHQCPPHHTTGPCTTTITPPAITTHTTTDQRTQTEEQLRSLPCQFLALSPERQRWTVAVVPAQVATTALDRCCRPDDSTRYFAVVGRRARSQANARSNLPKPLKPADVGSMRMDNAKTLGTSPTAVPRS